MGREWSKDMVHVSYGMVSLEGESMSTRKGHIVYLEDLLGKAIEKALAIINEKNPDLENKEEIARQIGIGSVIFFDLYNSRIKDIDFYWDRALNFEGETAPYVMYTHARCGSVLRKAGEQTVAPNFEGLANAEAQNVVRLLERFPDVVSEALERSEPSLITRFSVDLAQAYNKFYYEQRILDDDPAIRAARIALTAAVKRVVATALDLLGIAAPERM